jgi:hypothetical protein
LAGVEAAMKLRSVLTGLTMAALTLGGVARAQTPPAPLHQPPLTMPFNDMCAGRWVPGSYQGQLHCLSCPRGATLVSLQGQQSCVSCPNGLRYTTSGGQEACVR